jgi:hypothetical protein
MHPSIKTSLSTLAAVLLIAPVLLPAQTLAQQTRRLAEPTAGPSHIISVNPFLPLLGYFAGEYEQRIMPSVALALSGSHTKPDNTRYSNVDAKVRLYPSETALRGFNVAASLGIANIKDEANVFCDVVPGFESSCGSASKAFTTGTFAVEAAYQWLLGPSRVTAITVGGGAKRYLGSDAKFNGIQRVMPTLRLSIGYAF